MTGTSAGDPFVSGDIPDELNLAIWEETIRTAANTMLRDPNRISDGLEAELYALLEKLGNPEQPESTPGDAA
jgi:hypothetical protein